MAFFYIWRYSTGALHFRTYRREEGHNAALHSSPIHAQYYKTKDEYRELLTYQANLAGLFGVEKSKGALERDDRQEEK